MLDFMITTAFIINITFAGSAMAQERIRISSDWGEVTAELADNAAARALTRMLPVTISMGDHLRQEEICRNLCRRSNVSGISRPGH